jgi:uncharacterized protein YutE (UPF0331/DUF86 family)
VRRNALSSTGCVVVDRDVVTAKIAAIDRCLQRITFTRDERRTALLPIELEDIVVLNLQRAVQRAIGLATHVVTTEEYGLPDSVAAFFSVLERHGVIDAELADRLRKMAGFRNIAVHEYQALDPEIVEAIVTRHLDDLRAFSASIVTRFGF